ncbi:alpha/beta hydrolase family protein [Pedobacter paludis]|uniref:Peptidase S9 prolyl oligopeptidase catalytic domain-containing protein n=1 Tax=Pedobacter paludis TaxID=2203212 RepID=A0A317F3M7_9SPHI|nr:prolyl oligopeptidase family serine peptidase [Pedobacter paludis]PWS32647.1 hypothetical protein DF947_06130 [Pedobacter paludis]
MKNNFYTFLCHSRKCMLLIMIHFCFFFSVFGQKKILDISAIESWQIVDEGQLSPNGKWASYRILNTGKIGKMCQIIKEINTDKQYCLEDAHTINFSDDNRYVAFVQNHILCNLNLTTGYIEKIEGVNNYLKFGGVRFNGLLFSLINQPNILKFKTFSTNKFIVYPDVLKNFPIENGLLLLQKRGTVYQLNLVDPAKDSQRIVWSGQGEPKGLILSDNKKNFAFLNQGNLFIFEPERSVQIKNISSSDYELISIKKFEKDGNWLMLEGKKKADTVTTTNESVNIFSYQDATFNNEIERETQIYDILYSLKSGKSTLLNKERTRCTGISKDGKYYLISNEKAYSEYYWNKKQMGLSSLVRCSDSTVIRKGISFGNTGFFLKGKKKFIYAKKIGGDVLSIDLQTGIETNLTEKLPIPIIENEEEDLKGSASRGLFIIDEVQTGLEWNKAYDLLVADNYDLWLLDSSGEKKPLSITAQYGRKNKISLRLLDNKALSFEKGKLVYLAAFNNETKESGFYKLSRLVGGNPIKLTMDSHLYAEPSGHKWNGIKAKNANCWLVQRQSSKQSANYYWTSDFKAFNPISNIYPEKNYEWFTSELINYKTKEGIESQAIFYKPNDLDPNKKYPILFTFYEHESWKFNRFYYPSYSDHYSFNIPMMLAQGYLVCVPDIHFKLGETAQSIVKFVEGAADAIGARSYADTTKMGACGGSFGGYGMNCLAAFSRRFKAIIPISGLSNLFSAYGNVPGLKDEEIENRQLRTGISLSTDPYNYLKNSPIAFSSKVVTPVLIINTTIDYNVNVQQGIEWLNSLRREGKRSWMVTYKGQNHGVWELDYEKDLYHRMSQFFGHYLKDEPAPKWMMEELPPWQRSGRLGFELMPVGVTPGLGLNSPEDIERKKSYLKK